jgi:membrane-bound inhibitor of C-type lysozyme
MVVNRIVFLVLTAIVLAAGGRPAAAQIFANYVCADGSQVAAAFFPQERNVRLQLDGKSVSLPQRLSGSGARYAKGGTTFWIKGQDATLKRPKKKSTLCKTQ